MVKLVKQNFRKNKKLYQEIAENLRQKIKIDVPIDHVGSTAIPNMYGKNIIDILVGAKDDFEFQKLKQSLMESGYFPNSAKEISYQFFASSQQETASGYVHLHLAIIETERYREFLILKNYLLQNKDETLAYSNHKKEIIDRGVTDRKVYKAIKSEYVIKLLERAKKSLK